MPRVVIQSLAEARAALASAQDEPSELWSPPDAAGSHGVLWFVALCDALKADGYRARLVLDCGARVDLAIEAMRAGIHDIAFNATPETTAKVTDIARQLGARIHPIPIS